jgi:GNAT superfamily N-acetyltransferase
MTEYIDVAMSLPIEVVEEIERRAKLTGWSEEDLYIFYIEKEMRRRGYGEMLDAAKMEDNINNILR